MCISTFIKMPQILNRTEIIEIERTKVNPMLPKLKFDKDRVLIFQENVLTNQKLEPLKSLVNRPELTKPELDLCVSKLNDVIVESAIKTCPMRRKTKEKRKKGKKCWFNKDCSTLQRLLRTQCRQLAKHPFDKEKRQAYKKIRNQYKHTCRKAEKKCRHMT